MANQKPRSHRSLDNKCIFCGKKLCVSVVAICQLDRNMPVGVACYPYCDLIEYQET